ncbi:IclR family transcriptional regulator [Halodesulfurarchaeum formicicum]|uniref:IclR family transcriptional regulator n=1 Tax=Halodesulfurarchaeum formicicum TaxID=1873524 RepID=A0A1D8S1P2_9EURY|nr:IclR family transcriptional regulator [Halodesulfurarchaeum formicicum]AOW79265.1 IclR family transcriptional regulator [Halodesulfurarchaeum formicicum]APE94531.1 IclR family transcriptional regulator [Halodesulfurarchaeum formicicum]
MNEHRGRTHETTNTSLRVLDAVADLEGATVSEIADELDMAVSTAHKHLQTLLGNGLIVKHDDEYQLGLKLYHLGSKAKRREPQFMLAREKTYELAERTREVVNFSVLENGRAITLFDSLDTGTLEGFQRGQYFYLHSTAAGKAMLAEMDESQIDAIIDQWGLPKFTEFTITDRETLCEELEQVRKRGYAVNKQESWENLKAVAVPVTDSNGEVLGAMDVSGSPHRISYERSIARTLAKSVDELERALESHTVLESHWNDR